KDTRLRGSSFLLLERLDRLAPASLKDVRLRIERQVRQFRERLRQTSQVFSVEAGESRLESFGADLDAERLCRFEMLLHPLNDGSRRLRGAIVEDLETRRTQIAGQRVVILRR